MECSLYKIIDDVVFSKLDQELQIFFREYELKNNKEISDFYKKIHHKFNDLRLSEPSYYEDTFKLDGIILDEYVLYLEHQIKIKNLLLEITDFQLSKYKELDELQKIADKGNDLSFTLQEKIIYAHSEKINNYQKGVKNRSRIKRDKWKLANEFFLEEIPRYKTLIEARRSAVKRAGLHVEERQLVRMMPDPRKKI